jgi:hypothetical protein
MKIWRGDSDPSSTRKLKYSVSNGECLYSNLINAGNPLAFQQSEFSNLLQQHVNPGWKKTHFLSFSKNKKIAEKYAIGNSSKTLNGTNKPDWDSLIAEIDLSAIKFVRKITSSISCYQFEEFTKNHCCYNLIPRGAVSMIASMISISNGNKAGGPNIRNIIAIDVYEAFVQIQKNGKFIDSTAINNSKLDEEVLIFPADPLNGQLGNTAGLDMGCLSQIDFFKFV